MSQFMQTIPSTIPRDINSWRAAAILYGDWGTSKAYVLGLAFALAGHSSFWYILAVCILTFLIGLNYLNICKFYPNGGGVYASVRNRSKVLALIGAFFLIADYLVTAALSALSAFHYLGVDNPEVWAIMAIGIIGLFNFLGPKHTGSLAIGLAVPTVIVILFLCIICIPFLPTAIEQLTPVSGNLEIDWNSFVGVIVALSGIEAIANTTGSMRLDPNSTYANPSVVKTSTPSILWVMGEVCLFTCILGLAMNALPGLEISQGDVNAPNHPNVRDAMLSYMGEIFSGTLFGPTIGHAMGVVISIVITLLLLSAVNTAMIALISLLFVLSRDNEVPASFQKLNRLGVPIIPTLLAFSVPMILLFFVHDVSGLANLYAIGFVGAIAVNLGATATNFQLSMKYWERGFMFFTCIIMTLIEISLFATKTQARTFVITIVGLGLLLRALAAERREKESEEKVLKPILPEPPKDFHGGLLVVTTGINRALDYALDEAATHNTPLSILFIHNQKVVTEADNTKLWVEDDNACKVFDYVISKSPKNLTAFLYTVTAHPAHSIAEIAKSKGAKQVIMGRRKGVFSIMNILRGTSVPDVSSKLPEDIELIVVY